MSKKKHAAIDLTPRLVDGVEYVTTEQAMQILGISRPTFYEKPILYLRPSFFDGKQRPWYRLAQVRDLRDGKIEQQQVITIEGMFQDWTAAARAMGVPATTSTSEILETRLPPDAHDSFGLPADLAVVLRGRFTLARTMYLCVWNTYWPRKLVADFLPAMKADPDFSVTGALAERGHVVARAVEEIKTRHPTLREAEQMQLISNEPILVLQRACYGPSGEFVLFSDMALRGPFFKYRREYQVDHWKEVSPAAGTPPGLKP